MARSFTPIQAVSVPSSECFLCPSMDLIAMGSDEKIVIQRTLSWQRVASCDISCSALCWSPDGSLVAIGLAEGGHVLYDVELGMTQEEEAIVHKNESLSSLQIVALAWSHVGKGHQSWIRTDQEMKRDLEWSYRSDFLDRTNILPPSSYHQGEGENEEVSHTPTCKKPLSILCAAAKGGGVALFVHGRYAIAHLPTTSPPLQMVSSSDLVHLSLLLQDSRIIMYSIPAISRHCYTLQTISAIYSSIQTHLTKIGEGIPSVVTSWRNALKPLDTKVDALQRVLSNYGFSVGLRTVLLHYIVLGRTSEYANALDQFFTGVQMNDQLLVRMEKSLHNALANSETLVRSSLLAPARALVLSTHELCGLDEQLLPDTAEIVQQSRKLLYAIENLLVHVIDARFRIRDFVAWLRGSAAAVKAQGTPANSAQNENARKRRVSQKVMARIMNYLRQEAPWGEPESSTEWVIGTSILAILAGKDDFIQQSIPRSASPTCIRTSLFDTRGIPTVHSAYAKTNENTGHVFDQPRASIQSEIKMREIVLPVKDSSRCAVHPRMGLETVSRADSGSPLGALVPKISHEDSMFSYARQWTVIALPRLLGEQQEAVQLILLPTGEDKDFLLSRCLLLPRFFEVKEIAFYGDDGRSSLMSGKDAECDREGRQRLGLLLEHNSEQELWLIEYDRLLFDVTSPILKDKAQTLDIGQARVDFESSVVVSRDTEDGHDGYFNLGYLPTKIRNLGKVHNECLKTKLFLCGSRGVGGVLARHRNQLSRLSLFDLEEDEEEEGDEDDEEEIDV